jgi:hypothetical protein
MESNLCIGGILSHRDLDNGQVQTLALMHIPSYSVAGLVFREEIELLIVQQTMRMQARLIDIGMFGHAAQW